MNTVGFRRRLAAFLIDCMILSALSFLINLVATSILGLSFQDGSEDTDFASIMTGILLPAFYFVYFHGSTGRTPGKGLVRIQVVRVSGEPLTFGPAFLRWVGYLISALPLFAGFVWIIFDGKKQGWHDKLAQTVVIHHQRSPQTRFNFDRPY